MVRYPASSEVMSAVIVEISQFRLVPGSDERAFVEAAEETQSAFLARQGGFVSRDLLRGEDGSCWSVAKSW
jgi:hypothetical protein